MKTTAKKTELAELLQVSSQTIDAWRDKGLPRQGRGKGTYYNIQDCIEWVVEYKVQQTLKSGGVGSKLLSEKEAKAAKLHFEAKLKEYEYHQLRGDLVKVDRVEQYMNALTMQLKDAVLGIPFSWADKVIGLKDRPAAIELLDGLSRKLLDNLSEQEFEADD